MCKVWVGCIQATEFMSHNNKEIWQYKDNNNESNTVENDSMQQIETCLVDKFHHVYKWIKEL